MKDDNLFLIHIAESIGRIQGYASNRQAFFSSTLIQDAVIRNLEVIGEAAKRLPETTKERAPTIPWRKVCGMRDVLIHGYMGVDLEEVWRVVANELSPLLDAVNVLRTDGGAKTPNDKR
jgi:uncharacterized protein with HEPN domain